MNPSSVLGVDVGGTFTDLLLFDGQTKAFRTAKVPSQRGDEAAGFMQGIAAISAGREIGSIVHGTTVGTNSLLERRGHKIGVITTRGFRDVLEMRRRDRRHTWGLWGDFTPIAVCCTCGAWAPGPGRSRSSSRSGRALFQARERSEKTSCALR